MHAYTIHKQKNIETKTSRHKFDVESRDRIVHSSTLR